MGPPGEDGVGTRVVYESQFPIPSDEYIVNIPDITVNDMPSISVYVRLSGNILWFELPQYFEDLPDFGMACFFMEGQIYFIRCQDFYYQIVIIR